MRGAVEEPGSLRFVVMEGPPADYPAKFRSAIKSLSLDAQVESYPNFFGKGLKRENLSEIRDLLRRRHESEKVFFCPGAVELFLSEPDVSFQFSAYRSWCEAERTIVIPHPWTAVWPKDHEPLKWISKPPCKIGFMGSTYANSRFARTAANLPAAIRRWILQGGFLRSPDRAALLNERGVRFQLMSAFARFEAIEAVVGASRRAVDGSIEIVDTCGFDGTQMRQQAFAEHMSRNTYVLCPRGHENYSWRTYEAIRFGRVPVIFDTDMVLPGAVDWELIGVIVPGEEPQRAHQMILDDYRNKSEKEFLERQTQAFEASRYIDGESWLSEAIRSAVGMVETHLEYA